MEALELNLHKHIMYFQYIILSRVAVRVSNVLALMHLTEYNFAVLNELPKACYMLFVPEDCLAQ